MTPEARVRNPVVKFAKQQGCGHIRMSFLPGAKAGYPDDQFLIPGGRPLFWEFKRPGKEPTPLQYERIRELRSLGYDAGWSDNSDAAREAISRAMAGASISAPR